jgi:hypothetical protein
MVGALLVGSFGGARISSRYLARRYTGASSPAGVTFEWARTVHHARIGIVGFFLQHGLSGLDLTNHVQYVGRSGTDHSFTDFRSCRLFLAAVNRGGYDFVVVMPAFDGEPEPDAAQWMEATGRVRRAVHRGDASVFEVLDRLDPSTCAS